MSPASSAPSSAIARLLGPDMLARLTHVRVDLPDRVRGVLAGRHRSPAHGSSIEFAEHVEYTPGEEIRHIDWRAYARMDRPFVKRFEEETNLLTVLVVDASGSMAYGSGEVTKYTYAARLAAGVGFVLVRQQDSAGLLVANDEVRAWLPPRASTMHLEALSEVLLDTQPGGTTRLATALRAVFERVRRRSVVVVFSDFFDRDPELERWLSLVARRHRLTLVHTLDPSETSFPFEQLAVFRSMEEPREVIVEPRVVRAEYLRQLARFRERLRRFAADRGIRFVPVSTAEPIDRAVRRIATSGVAGRPSPGGANGGNGAL